MAAAIVIFNAYWAEGVLQNGGLLWDEMVPNKVPAVGRWELFWPDLCHDLCRDELQEGQINEQRYERVSVINAVNE